MDSSLQADLIREVLEVEQEWVEAHRQLDVATLERLMAEDYFVIRSDGSVAGKEEDLASYSTGDRHWEVAQSTPFPQTVKSQS